MHSLSTLQKLGLDNRHGNVVHYYAKLYAGMRFYFSLKKYSILIRKYNSIFYF